MAIYNYGLPVNYQTPVPYQQHYPIQQTISNTPIVANNNTNGITWVQGEAGAKAYPVAPSNSVLLMDSESECFYIKSTDASGMPMPLRTFTYTEVVQSSNEQPKMNTSQLVTFEDLDKLKQEFKQALDEIRPKSMSRKENKDEQIVPRNSAK